MDRKAQLLSQYDLFPFHSHPLWVAALSGDLSLEQVLKAEGQHWIRTRAGRVLREEALSSAKAISPAIFEQLLETYLEECTDTAGPNHLGLIERLVTTGGYSMELVNATEVAGPWWTGRFSRERGDYAEAEANAAVFRSLFFGGDELGPVLSLPKVAASAMGILVFVIRNSKIDGASAFIEGLPFVFVSDRFAPRMLFTLAHEIGHLVAHHDPTASFAIVDSETEYLGKKRNNKVEFYAHVFASCLLMPARGVCGSV